VLLVLLVQRTVPGGMLLAWQSLLLASRTWANP
jgi:hypothetical protein